MALDKKALLVITWAFLFGWVTFGTLFGWTIHELNNFDPFYQPLECTNTYLFAPKPASGDLVLTGYSAEMECTNKNNIKYTFGTASTGDVLFVKADKTTKDIGDVKLASATELGVKTQNVKMKLTLSMTMSAADLQAIQTQLASQAAANTSVPAVPLVYTFKPAVHSEMTYLFVSKKDNDFFPKKYCGFLVQAMPAGTHGGVAIPNGALKTASVTKCTYSEAEAVTAVLALTRDGGPLSANDHSAGYISDLDPPADYTTEQEGDLMTSIGILTRTFGILGMSSVGLAMTCATLWYRAKGSS